jgi:sterol desaturase/sphingolipid hydroxylase (fatty acid hydroxylase superfamily)
MANIRLFLLLFGVTQTVFVLLDFYDLWREQGRPPLSKPLRAHGRTFLALAGIWSIYFSIQLGLSAILPSVQSTILFFERALRLSPVANPSQPFRPVLHFGIAVVTFFVAGFWDYLTHRFLLHSKAFWLLHESHHLPTKVFNGMPGISARPFVAATSFLVNVFSITTMFLLFRLVKRPDLASLFLNSLPAIIFAFAFIGSANHSCFLRRYAVAHRWPKYLLITTPQEHVLHHSATQRGNFGNFTVLWDHAFGTYLDPMQAGAQTRLGLHYDQDFLGAITAGKLKLSARFRERWRLSEFCFQENSAPSEGTPETSLASQSAPLAGANLQTRRVMQ